MKVGVVGLGLIGGSMAKAVELNILYGDGDSIYPIAP